MKTLRIWWLILVLPLMALGAQAVQAALTVVPASTKVAVGATSTMQVSGASGTVRVSSSSTKVLAVSYQNGIITLTGKKPGTATVKVRDAKKSRSFKISVTRAATTVMTVSPSSVTLADDAKTTLSVSNANGSVRATSSNEKVVKAEYSSGMVKLEAENPGTATVTVRDSSTTVNVAVTVTSTSGGGGGTTPLPGSYTLLAWNDLGMHCMDGDFSVFSILPPFNTLHAQLVDSANNKLVTANVTMTYEAMADADGSINSISSTKTNFWQYASPLFGVTLPNDMGLAGNPTASLTPAGMSFEQAAGMFKAEGIPITPVDDAGNKNFYPMVKVVAKDSTGKQLAQARVVLPVSDEMSCANCHASGSGEAAKPKSGWVYDGHVERDYKKNILLLHDDKHLGQTNYQNALAAKGYSAAGLASSAASGKPVLCAGCHASNALGTQSVAGAQPLTTAIHKLHGPTKDPKTGQRLDDITNRDSCYQCHPGSQTKCLRGVMGTATLADGTQAMQCQSCHGTMSNVGSSTRVGWLDQPNCQACHHDGKREVSAVSSTGILKQWLDTRYATNPNAPASGFSLYRFSKGHGGLQCEACHGSTHAEYPSDHRNDNVLSQDIQGHAGTISECSSCHKNVPMTTTGGPHGMHTVGSAWVKGHESAAEKGTAACAYCHGADYRGSPLSTVKVARSFNADGKTVNYAVGQKVGCYDCHNGPKGD
ncbi:MAG: multiheme c-type cytochrome [Pseudomonadota bacterium]